MKIQFSIRELLPIVIIAALAAGWWIDRLRINRLAVRQWEYKSQDGGSLTALGQDGWGMTAAVRDMDGFLGRTTVAS